MFSYKLVENIRFTTNLEENRVLFTSATSFTLKRRALLPSSEPAKSLSRFWSHLFVNWHTCRYILNNSTLECQIGNAIDCYRISPPASPLRSFVARNQFLVLSNPATCHGTPSETVSFVGTHGVTRRYDQNLDRLLAGSEEGKSARLFRVNEVAEVNKTRFSSKLVVKRMFTYKS
jgi:hypothetical protein